MTKSEKGVLIEALTEKFKESKFFYVTEYGSMTVAEMNDFRRKCFENNVEYKAVKNTLIKKALENVDAEAYKGLFDTLKGSSGIMFSEEAKTPGVVLKEFRKGSERPLLKSAYIDTDIFLGDESIATLAKLKSKADLLGEVIGLLQSPMSTLLGQLNSGGSKIHALLQSIEERNGGAGEAPEA
jgi:large subunit ribosomal protein L10